MEQQRLPETLPLALPHHAGILYHDEPLQLFEDIDRAVRRARLSTLDDECNALSAAAASASSRPLVLLVPHAEYTAAAPIAAFAYKHVDLRRHAIERIVVLGAPDAESAIGAVAATSTRDDFTVDTPLGTVSIDNDLACSLLESGHVIAAPARRPASFGRAIDAQLPFAAYLGAQQQQPLHILPLQVPSRMQAAERHELGQLLSVLIEQQRTLFVLSTEFAVCAASVHTSAADAAAESSCVPLAWQHTVERDTRALRAFERLDVTAFDECALEYMCGGAAASVLLHAIAAADATRMHCRAHCNRYLLDKSTGASYASAVVFMCAGARLPSAVSPTLDDASIVQRQVRAVANEMCQGVPPAFAIHVLKEYEAAMAAATAAAAAEEEDQDNDDAERGNENGDQRAPAVAREKSAPALPPLPLNLQSVFRCLYLRPELQNPIIEPHRDDASLIPFDKLKSLNRAATKWRWNMAPLVDELVSASSPTSPVAVATISAAVGHASHTQAVGATASAASGAATTPSLVAAAGKSVAALAVASPAAVNRDDIDPTPRQSEYALRREKADEDVLERVRRDRAEAARRPGTARRAIFAAMKVLKESIQTAKRPPLVVVPRALESQSECEREREPDGEAAAAPDGEALDTVASPRENDDEASFNRIPPEFFAPQLHSPTVSSAIAAALSSLQNSLKAANRPALNVHSPSAARM